MDVRTSVWPFDILNGPQPPERDNPNQLRCFLICPFSPKEVYDDLYLLAQESCNEVGKGLVCEVKCVTADKIESSGVIHSEIWHEIQTADVVVADVSGLNGNVMIDSYNLNLREYLSDFKFQIFLARTWCCIGMSEKTTCDHFERR
jgi:hypothetical protein